MKKRLLRMLFNRITTGSFTVTYWDGGEEVYGSGSPTLRLVFRHPLSIGRFLADPVLAFGEAYMDGTIEVDGDLAEVIRLVHVNKESLSHLQMNGGLRGLILSLGRGFASMARQKKDVQHHYDLGNDFFSLWLDDTMSYSCAYFKSPEDPLTQAQIQKIDHVLAKLRLKPGETLLDIGSGWGRLVIRAAQQYGVRAMGITLSEEQYRESRRRIRELDLAHLVNVELLDYRNLAQSGRTFDKIASVGMIEHVGRRNIPLYLQAVEGMLKPGGLALLHTITHPTEGAINSWGDKYIFPGSYIPSLREVIWQLPDYELHPLDVESLRMHYALTLDRWAEAFESQVKTVRERYGERFVRMWRLYLRGGAASFRITGLDVHQILVSKGLNNTLPLTRAYRTSAGIPSDEPTLFLEGNR